MKRGHFALTVVYASCFVVAMASTAIAGDHIDWEIKNRYRVFDYHATGIRTPEESAAVGKKRGRESLFGKSRQETTPDPFIAS